MSTVSGDAAGPRQTGVQVFDPLLYGNYGAPLTGALQVLGNDGAGNVTAVTIVPGNGITAAQNGTNIDIAATAAANAGPLNWTGAGYDAGSIGGSWTIPITQTKTSVTDPCLYDPAAILIYNGYTQTSSSATSTKTATLTIDFNTDIRVSNGPTCVLFCLYTFTSGNFPVTGAAPICTYAYILPTTSDTVGQFLEYSFVMDVPMEGLGIASYSTALVPYIYVPAGATVTGTNIVNGFSDSSNYYGSESDLYSSSTPNGSLYIETDSVSMQSVNTSAIIQGGSSSYLSSTPLYQAPLISFGEPSYTTFRASIPIYLDAFPLTIDTVTLYLYITLGGGLIDEYLVKYNVVGLSFIFDMIEVSTVFEPRPFGQVAAISASYTTSNDGGLIATSIGAYLSSAGLSASFSPPGMACYNSNLVQYSSAAGSIALSEQVTKGENLSASLALPVTVGELFYFPPSGGSGPYPSATNLVSILPVAFPYTQSGVEVVFNFSFKTDVYSTAPGTNPPIVLVILAELSSTGFVISPFTKAHKTLQATVSGNSIVGTVSCRGRINVIGADYQIGAYAYLMSNTDSSQIIATSFTALANDGTAFGGTQCSWVFNGQTISTGGVAGTTGVLTASADVGSYLTAAVTGTNLAIGSTLATPAQAGLVASTTTAAANTMMRVDNSGVAAFRTTPQGASFGATMRLQFGGANVGQTVGGQFGEVFYQNGGATVNFVVSGVTYTAWQVLVPMFLNITAKGSSVGNATISGLPIVPTVGVSTSVIYFSADQATGITIPNSSLLAVGYTGGSQTIGVYVFDINGNTYTPATAASFATTNIQFRALVPMFTSTPPIT
jgi:hypothetical protein